MAQEDVLPRRATTVSCLLYLGSDVASISGNGNPVAVSMDSVVQGNAYFGSGGFRPLEPGCYLLIAAARWSGTTAGTNPETLILKNGAEVIGPGSYQGVKSSGLMNGLNTTINNLASGDLIQLAYRASSGSVTCKAGSNMTYLHAVKL